MLGAEPLPGHRRHPDALALVLHAKSQADGQHVGRLGSPAGLRIRDPYAVFPSTVNLSKSLYRTHRMQVPTFAGLDEYVFLTFTHMYTKLEQTRSLVHPSRFYELRYEDLVRDPLGEMQALYDHLKL